MMTNDELEQQIDRAVAGFTADLEGMTDDLAQRLVEQGYLSYDDLSVIEPDALMEMGELTEEQVDHIVNQAETLAEEAEKVADEETPQADGRRLGRTSASAAAPPSPAASEPASPPTPEGGESPAGG